MPWNALGVDKDEKGFILDVARRTLETVPGFDKDGWPDMADPVWGAEIFDHYGATPCREEYPEEKALDGGGGTQYFPVKAEPVRTYK